MLTYLGILLIILAEMIFSEYAPGESTNWSVFYFSSMYLSYILISLDQFIKSYDKTMRVVLFQCFLYFAILFVIQLTLINQPYDFYMESVNDDFGDLLRHIFFIGVISAYSFKIIIKRCRKPGAIS